MPVLRMNGTNVLFIHVPKAGGTSIERHLRASGFDIEYHDPHVGQNSMNDLRRCSPQHMHGDLLNMVFRLDKFDLIFMVVRHPLARFKSELAMQSDDILTAPQREVDIRAKSVLDDFDNDPFSYDNHLRPQREYQVDNCVVYRLEDGLDILSKDISTRLGIRLSRKTPWARRRKDLAGRSSEQITFSREVESRIRTTYAQDFSAFGYE